jgi:hypothetical protein
MDNLRPLPALDRAQHLTCRLVTFSDLTDQQVEQARTFLSNFGAIYTLSYDLLQYWVVNRTKDGVGDPLTASAKADGFEFRSYQHYLEDSGGLIWKSKPTQADPHPVAAPFGGRLLDLGSRQRRMSAVRREQPTMDEARDGRRRAAEDPRCLSLVDRIRGSHGR